MSRSWQPARLLLTTKSDALRCVAAAAYPFGEARRCPYDFDQAGNAPSLELDWHKIGGQRKRCQRHIRSIARITGYNKPRSDDCKFLCVRREAWRSVRPKKRLRASPWAHQQVMRVPWLGARLRDVWCVGRGCLTEGSSGFRQTRRGAFKPCPRRALHHRVVSQERWMDRRLLCWCCAASCCCVCFLRTAAVWLVLVTPVRVRVVSSL